MNERLNKGVDDAKEQVECSPDELPEVNSIPGVLIFFSVLSSFEHHRTGSVWWA